MMIIAPSQNVHMPAQNVHTVHGHYGHEYTFFKNVHSVHVHKRTHIIILCTGVCTFSEKLKMQNVYVYGVYGVYVSRKEAANVVNRC